MGKKFYQAYAGKFLPALVEKFSVEQKEMHKLCILRKGLKSFQRTIVSQEPPLTFPGLEMLTL